MQALLSVARSLAVAVGIIAALVPAASLAQGTPQRGGTLVMVVQPEPPTLASYQSTSGPIGQVATKVYEGLLQYDFNLRPVPGLAQSWTVSPDGKTITFKLQQGVKFHDGKPFTSEDVKFSILDVLKKGASARREYVSRSRVDRHAGCEHGHPPSVRAGAVHIDGTVGLRIADAAEARVRYR